MVWSCVLRPFACCWIWKWLACWIIDPGVIRLVSRKEAESYFYFTSLSYPDPYLPFIWLFSADGAFWVWWVTLLFKFAALIPTGTPFFDAPAVCWVALLPDLFAILCFEDWFPKTCCTAPKRPRLLPLLPVFLLSLAVLWVLGRVGICKSLLALGKFCCWRRSCCWGCIAR